MPNGEGDGGRVISRFPSRSNNPFKANIRRNRDGRYRLKFIFNENLHSLGDNEKIASNRLNALISRSPKEVLAAIDGEMESYVAKGYAELAPKRKPGEFAEYPPLHVVKRTDPSSPSFRIRIVKDSGCRSKDLASVNDVLIKGSNLLQNIRVVLARFRSAPIAIVADVEEACRSAKKSAVRSLARQKSLHVRSENQIRKEQS